MLRTSASASLRRSFPLLLLVQRFGITCKSKSSFLLYSSQSRSSPSSSSSSSSSSSRLAQCLNSIPNAKTVDAFHDIYVKMLWIEPLPPAMDFALLFDSAVEMRHYSAVVSCIRDLYSSSVVAERDESIMNILINCFCQLKHTDLGFSAMGYMFKLGLKPDEVTYITLINGLCGEGKVDQAIELSRCMEKKIDYQSKSNTDVMEAILSGFNEVGGDASSAFRFCRIFIDALCKDRFKWVPHPWFVDEFLLLNWSVPMAFELCLEMSKKGIEPTLVTYNCLLEGLCNSGRWHEASIVLIYMLQVQTRIMIDAASFNILAHALSQEGMVSGVKIIMSLMIRSGVLPDEVTFAALIYGYCSQNQMNEAIEARKLMVKSGCFLDNVTYNSLIHGFCKTSDIPRAADLIGEMLHSKLSPDLVTWNTFIHGCFRAGNSEAAMRESSRLSKYGQDSNVHTHNIILDGLLKCGLHDEAKSTFRTYELMNLDLNIVSYNIMLHGMCRSTDITKLDDAREIFSCLPDKGLEMDVYSYTIMINGLCNAALFHDAEELLKDMEQNGCLPDRMTYNVMVRGVLTGPDIPRAAKYLQIMQAKDIGVDKTTSNELNRRLIIIYSS